MNNLKDIINYGEKLAKYGLNTSIAGNISVLDNDIIIITKSGTMLDELTTNDFAKIDISLEDIDKIKATNQSSEFFLHKKIYQNSKNKAVIHSHSPFSIIMSLLEKDDFIIPADSENACYLQKIYITIGAPGSMELADNVSQALKDNKTVIIKGHGVVSVGQNLKEAYSYLCLTELACKIKYYCNLANIKM